MPKGYRRAGSHEKKPVWPWIACGCVVLVAVPVIFMLWLIPKMADWGAHAVEWGANEFRSEVEWSSLQSQWQPPAPDADPSVLFPKTVGSATLVSRTTQADTSKLVVSNGGYEAVYTLGADRVEVSACRASQQEKTAIYAGLLLDVEVSGADSKFTMGDETSQRLLYSFGPAYGPPTEKGVLFWASDWLLAAKSAGDADVDEFMKQYVRATGGATSAPANP